MAKVEPMEACIAAGKISAELRNNLGELFMRL
jgi:hypothetical protein